MVCGFNFLNDVNMEIHITKTDFRELLSLLEWSEKFIKERRRSANEFDHARRLRRILRRILDKNEI